MGFSRQEYWSGLSCLPLGDLSDPGIEPEAPAVFALQADSLSLSHQESPDNKDQNHTLVPQIDEKDK